MAVSNLTFQLLKKKSKCSNLGYIIVASTKIQVEDHYRFVNVLSYQMETIEFF